jgi:hypothetical protein
MISKKFSIALVLVFAHHMYGWQVLPMQLPKNETPKEQTKIRDTNRSFSFPIHSHLGISDGLIVGAATGESKDFALSIFDFVENVFKPYAHKKVMLNGLADQDGPLFNNVISFLALISEKTAAFCLQSDPKRIFMATFPDFSQILSGPVIKDANDKEIDSQIVALAGGQNYAFAAVKGASQKEFGAGASGIAVFTVHAETKEVELTAQQYEALKKEVQENGDEQHIESFTKEITIKDGKHTRKITEKKLQQIYFAQLSCASDCIKIGTDCREVEIGAMHWCPNLNRLYIGINMRGNQESSDGACGILVGRMENSKFILSPFISCDLVCENLQNQNNSIRQLRSMLTTTILDYLIVHRGNGLPEQTSACVFALPIVNFHGIDGKVVQDRIAVHGTIAKDNEKPVEAFSATDRAQLYLGRHFNAIPQSSGDFVIDVNQRAHVGGGPLVAGPIEDIFVKDDSVYAIVNNPRHGQQAGVYYSQAIFDRNGVIAAWTAWQPKAIMHDETISGMTIVPAQGSLIVASGEDENSVQTVKRTAWLDSKTGELQELGALIEQHFPKKFGGIQGMFDYDDYIGVLGLGKALLFDMNTDSGIIFDDEVVRGLGPLTAGTIFESSHQKLMLLGGLKGVAVLDLNEPCTHIKRIGDYEFVRKILVDENCIYILTDRSFDRIDVASLDLFSGKIDSVQLADARAITQSGDYGIFLDCAVCQKCALLAHSAGLHRVGNGKDIRADTKESLQWIQVAIPDCSGPVICLIPISISGKACDWGRGPGQFYVISGSIGNDTARLNRFAVSPVIDESISDTTIMPLPDFVAKDHISSFVNIGNFSPFFATDGTLFLTTGTLRKKKSKFPILVNSFKKGRSVMPLSLDADASINCIMRHNKSGNWMIGGDFGLIVNE